MHGLNYIVGIGGSAGGLDAYRELLSALPEKTGMAFVFVAHMSPTGESLLADILSWSTRMPVTVASDGMALRPDHVYVIPPNADLLIERGAFKVLSPRTMSGGHHVQVDRFLTSLAKAVGPHAISIILSGADGDGTEGCEQIKAKGGITFAQDLSAQVGSMPMHARASGCVDHVLSPSEIAKALSVIAKRSRASARSA